MRLQLLPGPRLQVIHEGYDDESEVTDVTACAVAYLYRPLEIDPGVRLSDCLGLLDACPTLVDVYQLNHAQAFADEARLGPLEPEAGATQLDYLELRRAWYYDTPTRSYSGLGYLSVNGVGPAPDAEPRPDADLPRGLQRWDVSLTPVRELLSLPVRLNQRIAISISGQRLRKAKSGAVYGHEILLGEVLRGILYELSWFGGPGQQQIMLEQLQEIDCDEDGWQTLEGSDGLQKMVDEWKSEGRN